MSFQVNIVHFLVLKVIAESLSEEEIGGLKELFKMIDTDNSGTITFDELKDGMRRVGSELMESEIQALMNAVHKTNMETCGFCSLSLALLIAFSNSSSPCFLLVFPANISLLVSVLLELVAGRHRQQWHHRLR